MSWIQSLSFPFMQHALIAILFAGVAFPLIGVFILSLNLIPLRFAMMHIALLGGAVGLFFKIDPLALGVSFLYHFLHHSRTCLGKDEIRGGHTLRLFHDPHSRPRLYPHL